MEPTTKRLGIVEIARQFVLSSRDATPAYVYDLDGIAGAARELVLAVREGGRGLVAYAVKANSAGPIVRAMVAEGCGADVVSGAELRLALACGAKPQDVVFSGVAKSDAEIDLAIEKGIGAIQAESLEEIDRVAARARAAGKKASLALRINPSVDAGAIGTHAHITTGHDEAKFGVPFADVAAAIARAVVSPDVDLVGLACHVGSQLTRVEPYVQSARALFEFARKSRELGASLRFVDTGGGFGIDYGSGCEARPADFVRAVRKAQAEAGLADLSLHVEPGRALVASFGVLVARVIQAKRTGEGSATRRWLMIDAGMNDLLRPALYQAHHRIVPLDGSSGTASFRVVGPVCESSCDFGPHPLPDPPPDHVAILDAGAYGYTMASQYNGRALPIEAFFRGKTLVARTERASETAWADARAAIREG